MKKVIRLGDPTNHGGLVIEASGGGDIYGKPVACKGDRVSCPKDNHGINPIVEGSEVWKIMGIPVALEGHKTACGCVLISTLGEAGVGA